MTGAPMDDNWIRRLNTLQLIVAGVIIMAPVVWMGPERSRKEPTDIPEMTD